MAAAPPALDFIDRSRAAVLDRELRRKLESASRRHLEHLAETRAEFPAYEAERDRARMIKQDAIGRLEELVSTLKALLEANGCKVFLAQDAEQAREYIVGVARGCGKRVAKGKSMTTEEIELNPAL
jgi:L-lactate utilization protein LutB